jgi:hypothetical protein
MNGLLAASLGVGGLFLPGFAVAWAFRMPWPLLSAFPLSCLLIGVGISWAATAGIPISVASIACGLAAVSILAVIAQRLHAGSDSATSVRPSRQPARVASWLTWSGLALLSAVVGLRAVVFPLAGFDTLFRWDLLARQLFAHHSLTFYPPRHAEDFLVYPYVDSIPPLTSGISWWLYEMVGSPIPAVTAVSVIAQFICCCGLTWQAANLLARQQQPPVAAALLAASPLFIQAVAIGQETGWTAISVAGQAAAVLAATRQPRPGLAIVAGLYAGIGCLARDYGPALACCGLLGLGWGKQTRRLLPAFLLTAAVCCGAWYVRTWLLTGNPVFSNPTPLDLPGNPVHVGIMQQYAAILSPSRWPAATTRDVLFALLSGAGALLVAGGLGVAAIGRRSFPFLGTGVAISLLWLWSAAYTAGGPLYSLRVLAPAWVILGILAGAAIAPTEAWLARLSCPRGLGALPLVLWLGWGLAAAAAHPYRPLDAFEAWNSARPQPLDGYPAEAALVKALDDSPLPACGILTDDAYLAAALIGLQSRFHPVMVWSPEVESLCDPEMSAAAGHRLLAERDVRLVSIGQGSLNWAFLGRRQFYRHAGRDWRLVFTAGDHKLWRLPSPTVSDSSSLGPGT